MNKKLWYGIAALVVVVVGVVLVLLLTPKQDQSGIAIGAVLPLTGEAAAWGVPAKQGAELAVREINSAGGIGGRLLHLYVQDSAGDPKTAVSALQSLFAAHPDIQAVVGAVASSETLAIAPIAERKKVVLITPASTSPKITSAGDFVFRDIPTDALRGKVFAEYVFSQAKVSRLYILYINNDAGVGNKDAFAARFKELGGTVLGEEAYPQGARDVRTQITKALAQKPQALMVVSYPDDTIVVVRQARELAPELPLFFQAEAVEDPSVRQALGSALDGVTYILPAKPQGKVPETFSEAYKAQYGTAPELFAAEAYDCILLIADAVRAAGGKADASKIRDYLYSVKGFAGASGTISFDSDGDVIKPMAVKTIAKGQPMVVYISK
jgi:branched-chain amino acid transport system substrate-binding protein